MLLQKQFKQFKHCPQQFSWTNQACSTETALVHAASTSYTKQSGPEQKETSLSLFLHVARYIRPGFKETEKQRSQSPRAFVDAQKYDLVLQRVWVKNNKIYINFNETAVIAKAASVLKTSHYTKVFWIGFSLEMFHPVVAHFAAVSDRKQL